MENFFLQPLELLREQALVVGLIATGIVDKGSNRRSNLESGGIHNYLCG